MKSMISHTSHSASLVLFFAVSLAWAVLKPCFPCGWKLHSFGHLEDIWAAGQKLSGVSSLLPSSLLCIAFSSVLEIEPSALLTPSLPWGHTPPFPLYFETGSFSVSRLALNSVAQVVLDPLASASQVAGATILCPPTPSGYAVLQ